MKKLYILSFFLLVILKGGCQIGTITFENSAYLYFIRIDTSNSSNIWQIGKPNKQFFRNAFSLPNVIITDSINPYSVNDTSKFYLGEYLPYQYQGCYTDLYFVYKMDSDTIYDYGKVEYSVDSGQTYYNLLQTSYFRVYDSIGNLLLDNGNGDTVIFTGKSNGWYQFWASFIPPPTDSLIFRFTFFADSIQNNRDGWMIDNIAWDSWWEGIQDDICDSKIFPNPVKNVLQIDSKRNIKEVSIISELGRTLLKKSVTYPPIRLNIETLEQGIYLMKIVYEGNDIIIKKLIIQK